MLIIPAIDLIGGRCVRLHQGDYAQETLYGEDPVEVAKGFEDAGASMIHVVDLDGARTGEPANLQVIERIASSIACGMEVGGGIRSVARARQVLDAGVTRLVVGTKLVENPDLAQEMFATLGEQVVAGIDARDGFVAAHGWTATSSEPIADFVQRMERWGACRLIVTDIATDGTLAGPNIELLEQLVGIVGIPIIASGGVGTLDDLRRLQQVPRLEGVIVGKALYEGRFTISEALGLSA